MLPYTAIPELGLGLEGTRREWTDAGAGAEHSIGLGCRLVAPIRGVLAFDARIEAANGDERSPDHTIGLRVNARW